VISGTKVTQFVLYLSCKPDRDMKPLVPHIEGEDYFATHRGDYFYFTTRRKEIFNSELLVAHVDNFSSLKVLLPHRPR
jgi:protease II